MKHILPKGLLAIAILFSLVSPFSSKAQYCTTSLYTYGCGIEWIGGFSTSGGITNISNSSTACTGGLNSTYYTGPNMFHTGAIGTTVNFSMTNGATCCTENVMIFVDWNIDGDWTDPGEDVVNFSVAASATQTGSFTIPSSATPGTSRLRVRLVYGGTSASITPCGSTTYGEAEDYDFIITSPCAGPPSGLNATNITSKTATVSWNAFTPTVGYDYIVDQNATAPSGTPTITTGTSAAVTGLTPSTNYYLHVRNKCSSTSFSAWAHYPFTTLPPCQPPIGFHTTNLAYNYTNINWSTWPSAISYDYVVDQNPADPSGTTGVINTTNTSAPVPGLSENTWYFVHLRSLCAGNEVSAWSLDSFLTPVVCRAPEIQIDHINTDEAVAYWTAIPTAYEYEYAISTSATPPAVGTKFDHTSIHTSALKDGAEYYFHVRSHCESVGIKSMSDWSTASFKTFALDVNEVASGLHMSVYPNPVREKVYVELAGTRGKDASIKLLDITGKTLKRVNVTSNKQEIDMTGLRSGIYILEYADNDRKSVIRINKL